MVAELRNAELNGHSFSMGFVVLLLVSLSFLFGCSEKEYQPGQYYKASYPPSDQKGQLHIGVTYTLWVPGGVDKIRGIIVHQHGAGTTASREGSTAAYDLQWQALARKWDCALLGPSYHVSNEAIDLTPGGSELWFDPRLGSEKKFLTALSEFSAQTGHPEIEKVPWVLWGHSGGGIWADVMACLHPDRVLAMWLRSGSAAMFRTKPEFPQPDIPSGAYTIPAMLNPGVKEKNNLPGIGTLTTFKEYRAKGAPFGFAEDPRTGHECGDSRYLAIPYLDACLALRLPDKNSKDHHPKLVKVEDGWLASLSDDEIAPAKEFKGNESEAVWLPNESVARDWREYIETGAVSDSTPPPAPVEVNISVSESGKIKIKWSAEADFESGIRCFSILRDGKELAQVPEEPIGRFGRPLFQSMTYHDTPYQPLPEMIYVDTTANADEQHSYSVITVNSVGLQSRATAGKIISSEEQKHEYLKAAFLPAEPKGDMVLWYNQPGVEWLDALPIGNGYMGAMVFGGIQNERIALNESSFWSGRPHDYNDPKAMNYFAQIKDLVYNGKYQEAEKMIDEHFYGIPAAQQAFQPIGDLLLSFAGKGEAKDYKRDLDMETGITSIRYRIGDVTYRREVFLSYPDRVLVVRLTADKPGSISVKAGLQSPYQDSIVVRSGDQLFMDGRWKSNMPSNWLIAAVGGDGLRFRTVLKALPEGGSLDTKDNKLNIQGADAVTFELTVATSYINYSDIGGNPGAICRQIMSKVNGKDYATLRQCHIEDFNGLMGRVHLTVGDQSMNEKPTDERLAAVKEGKEDANLEGICFQFGRYILASSSRKGGQPANLQGIWNESVVPNWGSKYTININTQMNYWPAEVCNLSECHQPLFDMINDISVNGTVTAQEYYGCEGWVTHHNIDLWRGTAPVDAARFGMWPLGGAWLCQHLWEHYAFTGDADFLKKYYPVMKGSAKFLLDYMEIHPKYQWLVTPFSMSPEHGFYDDNGNLAYVSPSPTMDLGIIRELFPHCIEASKKLGVDADFRRRLEEAIIKIPPYQIGKSGFLQEWIEDWKPGNQGHNFSRNFPFYPGSSIQLHRDKELSDAMARWMETRRSRRGFPVCWDICMWSRLERGDKVAECVKAYVSNSPAKNMHNRGANQSDATFGFTAGIAESLVQSHEGNICLLPALATNWKDGSVSGLKARNGFEVSMEWKDGKLVSVQIASTKGGKTKVRYGNTTVELTVKPGEVISLNDKINLTI